MEQFEQFHPLLVEAQLKSHPLLVEAQLVENLRKKSEFQKGKKADWHIVMCVAFSKLCVVM